MIPYYGDFAEDDTVDIPFNTFTSDDPSASCTITDFINTDVHIHKDGGLTQRNNAAGITVSVNFDGITGNHLVKIDTSDDTVAGFWVTGSEYQVRIEGATVDGATINAWIGAFSIERAGGVIALLKLIQAAVITNAAGADIAADIIAVKAETATIVNDTDVIDDGTSGLVKIAQDVAAILVDSNELQTDWIDGGRLDLLLDAIPTTAMRGTDGANTVVPDAAGTAPTAAQIKTAIEAAGSHLALIKTITDALPDAGALTTIATDAARLTAARAAVLTDWIDGGRLDLLLDAIKVVTDWQRSVTGTVVVNDPGTDTKFDLTAVVGTLSTENNEYNNMQLTIYDISGSVKTTRKINTWDGGNARATVDRALEFPVEDGVDTFILWNKYSPTAAAGGGATAQEVHEYDVSGITTKGLAGYEIQHGGKSSIYSD